MNYCHTCATCRLLIIFSFKNNIYRSEHLIRSTWEDLSPFLPSVLSFLAVFALLSLILNPENWKIKIVKNFSTCRKLSGTPFLGYDFGSRLSSRSNFVFRTSTDSFASSVSSFRDVNRSSPSLSSSSDESFFAVFFLSSDLWYLRATSSSPEE